MKLLLIPLIALLCFAQTAEVHDLTAAESTDGQRLYNAMKQPESDYKGWTNKVSAKYLKQGWPGDFSKGFKHIVPQQGMKSGQPIFFPSGVQGVTQ